MTLCSNRSSYFSRHPSRSVARHTKPIEWTAWASVPRWRSWKSESHPTLCSGRRLSISSENLVGQCLFFKRCINEISDGWQAPQSPQTSHPSQTPKSHLTANNFFPPCQVSRWHEHVILQEILGDVFPGKVNVIDRHRLLETGWSTDPIGELVVGQPLSESLSQKQIFEWLTFCVHVRHRPTLA